MTYSSSANLCTKLAAVSLLLQNTFFPPQRHSFRHSECICLKPIPLYMHIMCLSSVRAYFQLLSLGLFPFAYTQMQCISVCYDFQLPNMLLDL